VRCLFLALVLVACGASPPPEPRPAKKPELKPTSASVPSRAPGTLPRAEVVRFVNAGFWNFLQQVEVEPSVNDGRFRGWVIVALRPPTFWEGVDLAPGDVVTSVNDLPIERETEAFDAFQSMKTAPALNVTYVRRGTERRISYKITE
jgi:type II secretory pathway component PulC